jgi:hypothetical protein
MINIQAEVQAWLKTKNYNDGFTILNANCNNRTLLTYLSGNITPVKADKLLYLLLKLAGLKHLYSEKSKVSNVQKVKGKLSVGAGNILSRGGLKPSQQQIVADRLSDVAPVKKAAFNRLPLIIQELIRQKGHLWLQKDLLFAKLQQVPEDNTDKHIAIRRDIVAIIDHYSKRIDFLYQAITAFNDSKIIPSDDILIWSEFPQDEAEPGKKDFSAITDDDLRSRISNLRSYISKDENLLLFQSKSRTNNAENPMPPGPKRKEIETRIGIKQSQLAELIAIQTHRAGND